MIVAMIVGMLAIILAAFLGLTLLAVVATVVTRFCNAEWTLWDRFWLAVDRALMWVERRWLR